MTYRVGVAFSDPSRGGIHVVIAIPSSDPTGTRGVVAELGQNGPSHIDVATQLKAPTIFLPDDIALPLLDALAAHYGGAVDTRTLRADYLAERQRVDKLIHHLMQGE